MQNLSCLVLTAQSCACEQRPHCIMATTIPIGTALPLLS